MSSMVCRIDGCERIVVYRGKMVCKTHYYQLYTKGVTSPIKAYKRGLGPTEDHSSDVKPCPECQRKVVLTDCGHCKAVICGKPTKPYFESAMTVLGVPAERAVMVGDDILSDVQGAQEAGMRGALVKTGKFLPGDLEKVPKPPDFVLDTIGDLPGILG